MDFHVPMNIYLEKYRFKYLALLHALRDAIVAGELPYGTRLPSTREMAALYVLSRGSVNQAYEMLHADGYVSAEAGRGTFVTFQYKGRAKAVDADSDAVLSEWGGRVNRFEIREPARRVSLKQHKEYESPPVSSSEEKSSPSEKSDPRLESECIPSSGFPESRHVPFPEKCPQESIHFSIGFADVERFPFQEWNRHMHAQLRAATAMHRTEAFASLGHYPLREAISKHLSRTRGIQAGTEEIAVVNGSMQAIALLTQLLVNQGDRVVVENPGYNGTRQAIEAAGGIVHAATVDEHGIQTERRSQWISKLLFVTPSRQFPTGAVLNLERRQQLLQWASERGAFIVEDDYDSEFRRKGRPIEPLKVLDKEDRIIYIGTFSKTLLHDLRVGFAVLPRKLAAPFQRAKQLFEPHPAAIMEQRALATFMQSGQYEKHLRRMKRIYSKKHEKMYECLQRKLSHLFNFVESDAGLHIYGEWRHSYEDYTRYKLICCEAGIEWSDASGCFIENERPAACFGFSHLSEENMERGIQRAADLWFRGSYN